MILHNRVANLSQITRLSLLALLVILMLLLASVVASNAAQFVDTARLRDPSPTQAVTDVTVSVDPTLGMLCYRACSLVR